MELQPEIQEKPFGGRAPSQTHLLDFRGGTEGSARARKGKEAMERGMERKRQGSKGWKGGELGKDEWRENE